MKLQKYRIYLVGAFLFSMRILVGYFLNLGKHHNMTAKEWYNEYREVALSRSQIVDCVRNSYYESDATQTLEEVKRCTYLVDLVPVDLGDLQ